MTTLDHPHQPPDATDRLLAELLSRMDNGEQIDLEAVKQENPASADEIEEFFNFPSDLESLMRRELDPTVASLGIKSPERSTGVFSAVGTVIEEPAKPAPAPEKPAQIGRYLLKGELGHGTFGHVYRGFDPETKRSVAIKQMVCRSLDADSTAQLFRHEAETVARLSHPGIVSLLDIVVDDPNISLVFEYVDGPTLHHVLKEKATPTETLVGWIAEVADALAYAHRSRVVHRDLKPANIMLKKTDDGGFQPKLLDFGLASAFDQYWRDGVGQRIGSYAYMSPEQAAGTSEWATPQSDIFSLGVMLYQALTGELPFKSRVDADLLRQIQRRTPASPRSLCSTISNELEQVCMKAMEKRPADRYSSAADMARDLRAALVFPSGVSGLQSYGGSSMDFSSAPGAQSRGLLPWAIGGGVAALAAMLIAALLMGPRHAAEEPTTENIGGQPDGSVLAAQDIKPVPPAVLPVQEVQLAFQVHTPEGDPITLDASTRSLKPADKFRITAETAEPSYLYAVWFGADNSATVIAGSGKPQELLQSPAMSNSNLWPSLGARGEGYHMVLVLSAPAPLSAEQMAAVTSANWRTPENQGESYAYSFNKAGYPAVSKQPKYLTRGIPRDVSQSDSAPPAEGPLGALDSVLQDELGANYQAVMFSVSK